MKMRRLLFLALTMMLTGTLFTGCKSNDKSDINDIIAGTWVLDKSVNNKGYVIDPDDGTEVTIARLELKTDKTFKLVYDEYESDSGTYEAGNAYIRFDYSDANKSDQVFLWQVLSFSDNTLHAKYKDTDHDLSVTVWLIKQ